MWFQQSPVVVVIAAVLISCCTAEPARRKYVIQNVDYSLNKPEGRIIANPTSLLSQKNVPGSVVIPLGFDQFSDYFNKKLVVKKRKPKPPVYIYPPFYPGYYPPYYPWPPIYPPNTTTEPPTTSTTTKEPTTTTTTKEPTTTTTTEKPTTTTTTEKPTTTTTTKEPTTTTTTEKPTTTTTTEKPTTTTTTKEPTTTTTTEKTTTTRRPLFTLPPWWPLPTRAAGISLLPGTDLEIVVREKPSERSLRFPTFFDRNQRSVTSIV